MTNVYGLRLLAQPGVRRAVLAVVVVVVLAYRVVQFIGWTGAEQWGYDFSFYWVAASNLLHGLPIYSPEQLAGPYVPQAQPGFLYPPPVGAFFAVFALLFPDDPLAANWLWAAIGAAILVASVLRLAAVERLADRYPLLAGRGRWWLVAAAFAFPPVVDELVVGNVHLLLLGILTLAWLGLRSGGRDDILGGAAIGVAAVVKVFPGLLVVWLLLRRRLVAAGWAVVGAVAFTVVALPTTGIEPWRQYPTVLANLSSTPEAVDALAPTMWLTPVLGFTIARVAVTLVGLGILVAVRRSDLRLSFAVAVVVAVLATPAMYASYLTLFVLPLLLGLAAGVPLRWLGLAYLLMWGGQQPALGDLAWVVNRAMPTAGALVLLGALVAGAVRPATLRPGSALRHEDSANRVRRDDELGHDERREGHGTPAG
jgi:alpha-1,2-mannosyltransferase